ncbi:MAG: spermidine/putrescine ABC transporter substrate-binding protein [Verrucomicrobiota bacterium]
MAPSVITKFEEEFGIEVKEVTYENQEELYALLEAENYKYDLAIASRSSVKRLSDRELIRELDSEKLSGMGDFNPKFRNLGVDPENRYTVPYFWGSTLVAYRSDLVPFDPEKSFSSIFNPELAGKTAVLSDHMERFAVANKHLGVEVNDRSEASLKSASDVLTSYVKDLRGKFLNDQDIRDQLKSGELWLSHCYNGDAAMIANEMPVIKYFLPEEGAGLWLDLIVMTREAKNQEAAYNFISFMNRADICAENANYVCYATPNEAAMPLVDKKLLEDPAIFPPSDLLDKCEFFEDASPEQINRMSALSGAMFGQAHKSPIVSETD